MAELPSQPAFSPETHDISATPKRTEDDIRLDRHIRRFTFYVTMALLSLLALGAAYLAFWIDDAAVSGDTKEWARGTLSAIVGGVVGFAFAKK